MKINILYIIWSLDVGGAERIVVSLAKYINKDKYNPIVCCLNYKGKLAEELEGIGIKVIALDKKPNIDLSIIPKLIRVIKEHRIHIVHTHLWTADFWGRIAAKIAGVPVVISTIHSVDFWKPKIFMFADKILSIFTDNIIAISQEVKKFYVEKVKISARKMITIYNGIDLEKFHSVTTDKNVRLRELGIIANGRVIGIIGRLVELKGHKVFLDMMNILKRRYPDIKGIIIGDGLLREELVSRIKELKLEKNVILTGLRSDIPEMLNIIDVLVSCSDYEGLPMVVLEAMGMGKPVVATAVGGNYEVVDDGKTGFLVTSRDASAMAEKVVLLLEDNARLISMAEAAREKVKNLFSLEKMIKETEEIYFKTLTKKLPFSEKIKIVLVIDLLGTGGAERQLIELVKNIDREKFEISVVSLSTEKTDLLSELIENNIEVKLIDQWGKICIPTFINLYKFIKLKRPDIVHTYLFTASLYGRIVARLAGVPFVISSERSTEVWKKKSYIITDYILSKFTNRIIVNAKAIKEMLIKREKIPAKKIQVIYNGLDLNRLISKETNIEEIKKKLNIFNGNKIIGIVGRLTKEKDHITFLRAAKIISDYYDNANFLVVGGGDLRGELEGYASVLGISNKVIFTGKTNNVAETLRAIDVFVSTSLYEGCSNAILEAMASGLPVVATKVGGNPEIVNDGLTGILVPPRNPDLLAEAVLSLLNNPELRKTMGKNGRERIESDFILSKMVSNTEGVYESLVSRN